MKYLGAPQSGSQANTTASRGRAGQYYRNRRSPVQPIGTGRRAIVRAAFGASSSAYAAMTGSEQAAWATYAATRPYTDSLGQVVILSGHQMFVAINAMNQNVGQPIVTVPPADSTVFSQGIVTVSAMADGTVVVTLAAAGLAQDFSLIAFSKWQSGGRSFCKVFWQASVSAGNDTGTDDYSGQLAAQFGLAPFGSRIFYSIKPVNQYGVAGVPIIGYTTVLATGTPAVATAGLTGIINWTIAGATPFNWIVQTSSNGGLTWQFAQLVDGALTTAIGLTPGLKARVVGTDAANVLLNGASNAVTIV